MELLMNTQKECQQLEVYGEYLKKIPELLKQLETVEKMYQKAISGNYDIVLCDILGYDENTKQYITDRAPYKKEGKLEKKESILLSTRPVAVSACTKLFRRDIFQSFSFQSGWYEDLGIMTTIFSFTGDICYLPEPLYVYRWNRKGSI